MPGLDNAGVAVLLHVLRALRFLFSVERNRKFFRRLFPHQLYGKFVDVGHYEWDLREYSAQLRALLALGDAERRQFNVAIDASNIVLADEQPAPAAAEPAAE